MESLDTTEDFKKAKTKVTATQSYNNLKSQYRKASKKAGDTFEMADSKLKAPISKVKEIDKKFKKVTKNLFEELFELLQITNSGAKDKYDSIADKIPNSTSGNLGANIGNKNNTTRYVKKILLKALKNIEPKIIEILNKESLSAVGCDQQQTFTPQTVYIKVKSIDLSGLLKIDPISKAGKVLFEKSPIQVQITPFSMNRELYHRIQTATDSYNDEYGQKYVGASGQELFDIQYFDSHPITFESGGWFGVTLYNRFNNINKVGEFMIDYYRTINLFEFQNVIANIMEQLSGVMSINLNVGLVQATDLSQFQLILQRILGLCFDGAKEIDVSGISKISELDGVDDSFFEFTSIDLRNIDQKITNIKNGVVEFDGCGDVKLPVDSQSILNALNNLNFIEGTQDDDGVDAVLNALTNNPDWQGLTIDLRAAIDLDFIKLIAQGLIFSLLSPKVLLPILTILKSLGDNTVDVINSFIEFAKKFRTFLIKTVSKIGALFVKELFELIKQDIKRLIQQVILDVLQEKSDKRVIMILKLIQVLLVVARFISDWRQCKSVVDEILWLLKIATSGSNIGSGGVPLPLLMASQLLDGYSESRAFLGTIEELQKIGIPTGPLPDGSPNLEVLSKFSQMKAMASEEAENGKVQIAVGPLSITPAGLTVPASAYGKKM